MMVTYLMAVAKKNYILFQIWNKLGSDECSARLDLKDKPPKFTQELKDQKVCEDVEVVFLCKVKGKTDEVTWCLNGQELEESDNVIIGRDADRCTLTFRKVKAQDHAGKITCKVRDELSFMNSSILTFC